MNKFKVGDAIVYSKFLYPRMDFCIGDKFEVTEVYDRTRIKIKPIGEYHTGTGGYFTVDQFELADPTLTPEEVLQHFKEGRQHELDYTTPDGTTCNVTDLLSIRYLTIGTWRVKPVPQTIDYYGTAIPKPVTKEEAEAENLSTVYRPQLAGEHKVRHLFVDVMKDYNVYFRTESEALQVAEVLLKPFK